MGKLIYLCIFLLISKTSFSQNINLIIKVNEKLLNGEISNIRLEFQSGKFYL
jgi:hypothetical protein